MKVYLVEFGEYSSRFVQGVYSTREKAEATGGDVREIGLDDWLDESELGLIPFRLEMDMAGNVAYFNGDAGKGSPEYWIRRPMQGPPMFSASGWAKNREHAIKIANEQRIIALASVNGTEVQK